VSEGLFGIERQSLFMFPFAEILAKAGSMLSDLEEEATDRIETPGIK